MPNRLRCAVVMGSYCGARYVEEQLQSIIDQTRAPDAVLILDDASSDETYEVVSAFDRATSNARGVDIYAVRNPINLGVVGNFSLGLWRADGELIALADQDDRWHVDKLARQMELFETRPDLLLVHGNAQLVDADGQQLGATLFDALGLHTWEVDAIHAGNGFEVLVRRSIATGATIMLRRELVEDALPVGNGWLHDEWLALIASAIGQIDVIEDCLIDYRQHGRNVVGMRVRTWRDKWAGLRMDRSEQFGREVDRLRLLDERLATFGERVAPWKLELLRVRVWHLQRRLAIGKLPYWKRLPDIWCEWRSCRYGRYGTGFRSALRDLLRRG